MARVSECQFTLLIASLGSFVGHDGLLPGLGQLLFFLFGIDEFMTAGVAGIKPLQERFGSSLWLARQDNDGVCGALVASRCDRWKSRLQASALRIEDTDHIQVVGVRQFEQVGSG